MKAGCLSKESRYSSSHTAQTLGPTSRQRKLFPNWNQQSNKAGRLLLTQDRGIVWPLDALSMTPTRSARDTSSARDWTRIFCMTRCR